MKRGINKMDKLDLKKQLKAYYNPSAKEPEIVDVPKFNYLMIDGMGDPNTSKDYQEAIAALYGASYTIKFMMKAKGKDYTVMGLEGLWWTDGEFDMNAKDKLKWTAMVMQPDFVTKEVFEEAKKEMTRKKKDTPALGKVRFGALTEGLSAQIMHIGPYEAETATIQRLHKFIEDGGYKINGKHHEIYMSDPRKVAPEKNKTIIRYPITKKK